MSFWQNMPKKLLVNAFRNQQEKAIREKMKKKGRLIKILEANQKRSIALVDILKESDTFNTMSSFNRMSNETSSQANETSSNEEFLKKFRNIPVGE